MENTLLSSLTDYSCKGGGEFESRNLNHLFNKTQNSSPFIYDYCKDKCIYISPYIWRITGYLPNEFMNKGILFFKTLIHPDDYSKLICDIVTFIRTDSHEVNHCVLVNTVYCKLKHKTNAWVNIKVHVINQRSTKRIAPNKLIGYIQEIEPKIGLKPPVNNITSREKQVLRLIASGDSAKVIGRKLNICENTVVSHRKHLKEKLNAKNTAELIKIAAFANFV
ncbi:MULTISPECIES: LuxR C-terminal-related transcriptional regulator [unclassified Saccharicrinis]|uniref:LuxR C-terminal-related transcriptional regulator n=1 Tax=unclassified Saccharicrinis TaxID=2646859 RepID=UPI003D35727E